jgi:hypothetical protein
MKNLLLTALVAGLPVIWSAHSPAHAAGSIPVLKPGKANPATLMAKASLDGEEAQSINAFLKRRGAAQNEGDAEAQMAAFDFAFMIREAMGGLTDDESPIEEADIERLLPSMQEQMKPFFELESYTKHKLTRLELSASKQRAIAWVTEQDWDGIYVLRRYWLKKSGDSWKIYDQEDSGFGTRMSLLLRSAVSPRGGKPGKVAKLLMQFGQAAAEGDLDALAEAVSELKELDLGPDMGALLHYVDGHLALEEGEGEKALELSGEIKKLLPEGISHEELAYLAHSILGNHEACLKSARAHMDFAGLQPENAVAAMDSLIALKRPAEVKKLLQQALDEYPDSPELLDYLPEHLGEEQNSRLAAAVKSAPPESTVFDIVTESYEFFGHDKALTELLNLLKKQDADHELVELYSGHLLAAELLAKFQKEPDKIKELAQEALQEAAVEDVDLDSLTRQIPVDQRKAWLPPICESYLKQFPDEKEWVSPEILLAGVTLAEYYRLDAKWMDQEKLYLEHRLEKKEDRDAFVKELAEACLLQEDADLLELLVDALKELQPDSPLLKTYEKKLQDLRKKFEDGTEEAESKTS